MPLSTYWRHPLDIRSGIKYDTLGWILTRRLNTGLLSTYFASVSSERTDPLLTEQDRECECRHVEAQVAILRSRYVINHAFARLVKTTRCVLKWSTTTFLTIVTEHFVPRAVSSAPTAKPATMNLKVTGVSSSGVFWILQVFSSALFTLSQYRC